MHKNLENYFLFTLRDPINRACISADTQRLFQIKELFRKMSKLLFDTQLYGGKS